MLRRTGSLWRPAMDLDLTCFTEGLTTKPGWGSRGVGEGKEESGRGREQEASEQLPAGEQVSSPDRSLTDYYASGKQTQANHVNTL